MIFTYSSLSQLEASSDRAFLVTACAAALVRSFGTPVFYDFAHVLRRLLTSLLSTYTTSTFTLFAPTQGRNCSQHTALHTFTINFAEDFPSEPRSFTISMALLYALPQMNYRMSRHVHGRTSLVFVQVIPNFPRI